MTIKMVFALVSSFIVVILFFMSFHVLTNQSQLRQNKMFADFTYFEDGDTNLCFVQIQNYYKTVINIPCSPAVLNQIKDGGK